MLTMHITNENLVIQRGKTNTHFAIFRDDTGVEYIRPLGPAFVALASITEKGKREITQSRGAEHVYPHRGSDLPSVR
jgi:hypothetical protein